jgi:sec-independent protein translocase protein TatA
MGGRLGEIILILILLLLFFGPNKLPDMAKGLGQALNEFKKALNPNPTPDNQNSNQATSSAKRSRRPASRRRAKK